MLILVRKRKIDNKVISEKFSTPREGEIFIFQILSFGYQKFNKVVFCTYQVKNWLYKIILLVTSTSHRVFQQFFMYEKIKC